MRFRCGPDVRRPCARVCCWGFNPGLSYLLGFSLISQKLPDPEIATDGIKEENPCCPERHKRVAPASYHVLQIVLARIFSYHEVLSIIVPWGNGIAECWNVANNYLLPFLHSPSFHYSNIPSFRQPNRAFSNTLTSSHTM